MIEIYSRKNYKQYIFLITIIFLVGLAILFIIKPKNFGISLVLFIFLGVVFLSRSFTDKISIVDNIIVIAYYKWGFMRLLEFDIKNIRAEVGKTVETRGYKNKSLNIFYKNKLAYTFNTGDGFSDEDIETVEAEILQQSDLQKN